MTIRLSIFVFIFLRHALAENIAVSFSTDYFTSKSVHQMTVFGCWPSSDAMKFFRKGDMSAIALSYVPIQEDLALEIILKVNYYKLGVLLDLDCPNSNTILSQVSRLRLPYNESYYWLMITDATSFPTNTLYKLPLTVESELTVAMRRRDSYILHDVYNPSYRHGGRINVTYMGYWQPEKGVINELTQYKYKRRQNFHGLTLNFSVFFSHPPEPDVETYLTTPINRHLDTMIRFHYALVLQLKDTYNFSINMLRAETWGYRINGSYNGIIGDMIRGMVDMSVAPFRFTVDRLDYCDYTVQTYVARPCFIFRHPKTNHLRNVFLKPFKEDVWWLIIAVAVVYWLLLLITVTVQLHYEYSPKNGTLDTNPASETALIVTAALCQQGLSDGPRIYSGRIVFLSLFLWALLLYQFYSASIVGSLLAQPPRFINNLNDLADSNLEIGIEDIGYNYDYIATSSDPSVHRLIAKKLQPKKKRKKNYYLSPTEGLQNMQNGGYAFHVDIATAYKMIADTFTEDQICDLEEVQLFPPRHVAIITSKNSPFRKMSIYTLRQMVEHGITKRLRDVWHSRRPQCPSSHSSIPVPVAFKEFSPAIFSLIIGITVASFVMLLETYIEHCNHSRRNKLWMIC